MKKIIFLILLSLVSITSFAWSKHQYSVTYDSDFNPIVSIELTNGTGKIISNIDFIIFIKKDGASQWDVMAIKELHINQSVNMRPSGKNTFKLKPNVPQGWKVDAVGVEKIRFSDGSIKQY